MRVTLRDANHSRPKRSANGLGHQTWGAPLQAWPGCPNIVIDGVRIALRSYVMEKPSEAAEALLLRIFRVERVSLSPFRVFGVMMFLCGVTDRSTQ